MSEYQYYEFAAVDGPISEEGMRYARSCSTRASVSSMRWQNTYTFGDFHGNVDTLLKYYDAHFYIANWGSVRLGLAFPKDALPAEAIQPFLWKGRKCGNTLTLRETGNRRIVWWEYDEEGAGDWTDGNGLIDELLGIREELMRGDYRALFLGWLADFDPEEYENSNDAKAVMPPAPAGLDRLSPALEALIEHFPVDEDALAKATELTLASIPERIPMAAVLARLSVSEMRAFLARVADGGGRGRCGLRSSPPRRNRRNMPGGSRPCFPVISAQLGRDGQDACYRPPGGDDRAAQSPCKGQERVALHWGKANSE